MLWQFTGSSFSPSTYSPQCMTDDANVTGAGADDNEDEGVNGCRQYARVASSNLKDDDDDDDGSGEYHDFISTPTLKIL